MKVVRKIPFINLAEMFSLASINIYIKHKNTFNGRKNYA